MQTLEETALRFLKKLKWNHLTTQRLHYGFTPKGNEMGISWGIVHDRSRVPHGQDIWKQPNVIEWVNESRNCDFIGILSGHNLSHKERGNPAICDNVGGPGGVTGQTGQGKASSAYSHVHVASRRATVTEPGHGRVVPGERGGDSAQGRGDVVARALTSSSKVSKSRGANVRRGDDSEQDYVRLRAGTRGADRAHSPHAPPDDRPMTSWMRSLT